MQSALIVAAWLAERPEIGQVLYPALPGAPGHAIWQRDFTGAASLFSVVFRQDVTADSVTAMIDSLTLFGIGSSWGGYESLMIPSTGHVKRSLGWFAAPTARLHIGLEDPADLIADLTHGFERIRTHA
jgi:cystathionine beta-lyase